MKRRNSERYMKQQSPSTLQDQTYIEASSEYYIRGMAFVWVLPVLFSIPVFANVITGRIAAYERWTVALGMLVIDFIALFISFLYIWIPCKISARESSITAQNIFGRKKTYSLNDISQMYGSVGGLLGFWDSGYPAYLDVTFKSGGNLRLAISSFREKDKKDALFQYLMPYLENENLYANPRAKKLVQLWKDKSFFTY